MYNMHIVTESSSRQLAFATFWQGGYQEGGAKGAICPGQTGLKNYNGIYALIMTKLYCKYSCYSVNVFCLPKCMKINEPIFC